MDWLMMKLHLPIQQTLEHRPPQKEALMLDSVDPLLVKALLAGRLLLVGAQSQIDSRLLGAPRLLASEEVFAMILCLMITLTQAAHADSQGCPLCLIDTANQAAKRPLAVIGWVEVRMLHAVQVLAKAGTQAKCPRLTVIKSQAGNHTLAEDQVLVRVEAGLQLVTSA